MRELRHGQRALVFKLVNIIVYTGREKERLKFNWQTKRIENRQIKGGHQLRKQLGLKCEYFSIIIKLK